MNQKLTSSLFTSLVALLFSTNLIFLWSIDDLSLNSSFLLRFVEGIMRPYHSSNQHKHFNKSNIMNVLFSTTKKIYLTFCDTNNSKNVKNNSWATSIFNKTHIFRSEYSFLIYTEKGKEEKIWIRTIILPAENSVNKNTVFNW